MSSRQISPAVYGIETEYSCMITLPEDTVHEIVGRCHSTDAELGLYVEPEAKGSSEIPRKIIQQILADMGITRNSNGMLSNGGRFYMDPSGPEYASAETTTAQEAVLGTFEGDEILLKMFEKLRKAEVLKGYQINRRVVDHNRTSRGIHLNTLTKLRNREPAALVILWLATLNIAKGALFGSGGLLVDEEGNTAFHHSPRLSVTNRAAAPYENYRLRPLVRVPFKPDGERLARIETVTSDALNFGWPLRASLVATNAVVGLIELGYGNRLPVAFGKAAALESAHNVGLYGPDGVMYMYGQGDLVRARSLDVIRNIAEIILEVNDIEDHLDRESDQVINEIVEVGDKMADDPYSVADQVESMARLVAMQRKMDKDDLPIDSERMCRFDYAWDWVGGGIAETLRSKGKVGWQGFDPLPSPSVAKKRLITPPQDTRAKIRGETIKLQNGADDSTWASIDFGTTACYMHPLETQLPTR